MMLAIQRKITRVNFTDRNTKPEYIVIHYVGAVSTARNNADYFYNTYRGASAHYFIDENSVWQVVEDNDTAWSVGGSKLNSGGRLHGIAKNSNTLNIEMCVKKKDGKWFYEPKTLENTADLVKQKMKEYGIPASKVIRHYDVTGKSCPANYIDEKAWNELHAKLTGGTVSKPNTSISNNEKEVSYKVKVTANSGLNCRKEPKASATKVTAYAKGTILTVTKESNGWLYVNGKGWVIDDYVSKVVETAKPTPNPKPNTPTYKVGYTYTLQSEMKVRTGAGTNYRAKKHSELTADGKKHDSDKDGALNKGTRVTCQKVVKNGNEIWIKTPSGYICAYQNGKVYIK